MSAPGSVSRPAAIVLAIVNAIVLLGQIWPEGAPPFARIVNIAFLVASLAVFVALARGPRAA